MTRLQLARYRLHWQVLSPLQLPPYAGSTLRGAFGWALRQQACLIRASECQGCALAAACPYPQLFEPKNVPRPPQSAPALAPYAIETPYAGTRQARAQRYGVGEQYHFDMVLMTPSAISQLPLILAAWQQAFAKGVGEGDGTARLAEVEHMRTDGSTLSLYHAGATTLQQHDASLHMPCFAHAEDVRLHLQTPLRIVQQGKLMGAQEMSVSLFLRHLIRRVSFQVCGQQADAFSLDDIRQLNALADQVGEGERHLAWSDWERYSTRQQRKMTLGGLLGHWQLLQVPAQLLPFIYLGQWLHVGKESAFGLGKYQWLQPGS